MDIRLVAFAAVLPLAACASMAAPTENAAPPADRICDADGVQSFIGQTATPDIGAKLLQKSGARTLRWVPPRTAVTMDFRPDRLTVSYDDAYKIDRVSCG